MSQKAAEAKWERLHKDAPWHDGTFTDWAKEPGDGHPFHMSHGVTIWVADSDLGEGGDFLSSPALDGADEPQGRDA